MMTIDIDARWAIAVLMLSCRFGAALLMTPLLGQGVPPRIRVFLVLSLSMALAAVHASRYAGSLEMPAISVAAVGEVMIGAALAFGIVSAFAAFTFAGKILDVQTGFGLANVFDPVTRASKPMLATALDMLAVTVFFALDGHHAVMRGLSYSMASVPPGAIPELRPDAFVRQFGAMFSLGLALVAPVFTCLMLVELATAVMTRAMPQANVMMVIIPAKIMLGIGVLALVIPSLAPAMQRIYATIFVFWDEVLRHG